MLPVQFLFSLLAVANLPLPALCGVAARDALLPDKRAPAAASTTTVPSGSTAGILLQAVSALGQSQPSAEVNAMLAQIQANAAQINNPISKRASAATKAGWACSIAKLIFPGSYVDSTSSNYTAETDVNWSTNCWLPAACFILPNNTLQVAIALKVVTLTGATFATRGAGHNQNPGFASTSGGVLIDMQRMNSLTLTSGNSILQTGPAARWGDVYAYLDPYGISAIGGRTPIVGVAGLLLGGGLPYFPQEYGWGCDNVQNYEVVLPNSFVIDVNAGSYPDLYKALKGGAANFGIVTRFDLYTRPLHNVWYTLQVYSAADYQDFFAAMAQSQQLLEADSQGSWLIQGSAETFLAAFLYAAPSAGIPSVFQPFFTGNVQPIAPFVPPTNGTILSLSQVFGSIPDPQESHYIAAATTSVNTAAYIAAWQDYLQNYNIAASTGDASAQVSFSFTQTGSRLATVGQATGGNSLGVQAVPQLQVNVEADYLLATTGNAAAAAVDTTIAEVEASYRQYGSFLPYIFQGEASYKQDVLASYGSSNLAALKAASQKYDPQQYFQNLQQGGFLVKNA